MAETLQDRLRAMTQSGMVIPSMARKLMLKAAAKLDELESRLKPQPCYECGGTDILAPVCLTCNPEYRLARPHRVSEEAVERACTRFHAGWEFVSDEDRTEARALMRAALASASMGGDGSTDSQELSGWIIGDSEGRRWRGWGNYGPTWQTDPMKAIRFARRKDAEAVFAEDEDAWTVIELAAAIRSQKDGE